LFPQKAVIQGAIPLITDDALIPSRQRRGVFVLHFFSGLPFLVRMLYFI
jgi:hypothetical protein